MGWSIVGFIIGCQGWTVGGDVAVDGFAHTNMRAGVGGWSGLLRGGGLDWWRLVCAKRLLVVAAVGGLVVRSLVDGRTHAR